MTIQTATFWIATSLSLLAMTSGVAVAAINIPFTINLSEIVTVTGTPRIAVDVGGNQRFANYTSGTGTNALTFTLSPTIGDVDLDGVTLSSPIELNGGTIKDAAGNDATLTFTPPNTTGIKVNYPSLGMDFTNGATGRYTLNGTVYNDISSFLTASGGTFSRNSIATYYDSTGTLQTASANTPRFDYDPVTHQPKGLLIEGSRTNLLKSSDNLLSNWSPNLSATVTYNDVIAPDGTMTADTISATASGAGKYQLIPITSGTTYTNSLFLKFISGSSSSIRFGSDSNATTIKINPQTMNIISNSANVITSNVNSVGGGWYRLAWSWSTPNTVTSFILYNDTASPIAFAVWGMQTEQGSFPTSYIPTTTTAVTRNTDSLIVPTGTWFNNINGSIAMNADAAYGVNSLQTGIAIHAIGNNGYLFYKQAASPYLYSFAGAGQVNLGSISSDVPFAASMGYTETSARASLNGILTGNFVPSSIILPTAIRTSQTGNWTGHLQKYKYYPLRVGDTQLQLLTQ